MASLLYGSGLRLMENIRLRVKDIDFSYKQITIRDGKGSKDRVTALPEKVIEPLKSHLKKVKYLHAKDKEEGYGEVYLPYALARKYPNSSREFYWDLIKKRGYVLGSYSPAGVHWFESSPATKFNKI